MHQQRMAGDTVSKTPLGSTHDVPDSARDSGHFTGDPAEASFETHWTRILHYDLFAATSDDQAPELTPHAQRQSTGGHESAFPAGALHKETSVAIKEGRRGIGTDDIRSQIRATAILLGFYVAMYVAVAGVLHALSGPDAVAAPVAHVRSTPAATTATVPALPSTTLDAGEDVRREQAAGPTDSARQCTPGAAVASDCIYH